MNLMNSDTLLTLVKSPRINYTGSKPSNYSPTEWLCKCLECILNYRNHWVAEKKKD